MSHITRLLRTEINLFIWTAYDTVDEVIWDDKPKPGRYASFVTRGALELVYDNNAFPADLVGEAPPSPWLLRAPVMTQGFGRMPYTATIKEVPCEVLYVLPLDRVWLRAVFDESVVNMMLGDVGEWLSAGVYDKGLFDSDKARDTVAETATMDLLKVVPPGARPT